MELRHLQTFAAAAQKASFTRAAAELGVTQATVSQQIAALEDELGTPLFSRGGRGVQLTAAGYQLRDYARQILNLVCEATQQVGRASEQLDGELSIASSTVPSEWLLPELLAEFRARWPSVHESLLVSDSTQAAAAVEDGEADVGFVGELPHSTQLSARAIGEDELALFVANDHPWARRGTATIKQLQSESLIVREAGSASRGCVERAFAERGLTAADFSIAMEVNSNETIRAAVQRGVGVAFLSERANRHQRGLKSIKIRGFRPRRQLYLITNSNRIPTAPSRQFVAFVEEWGPAHAQPG